MIKQAIICASRKLCPSGKHPKESCFLILPVTKQALMIKQAMSIKEAMSIKQAPKGELFFNPPGDQGSSYDQASYVHQGSYVHQASTQGGPLGELSQGSPRAFLKNSKRNLRSFLRVSKRFLRNTKLLELSTLGKLQNLGFP
jgi:hypothetical protein